MARSIKWSCPKCGGKKDFSAKTCRRCCVRNFEPGKKYPQMARRGNHYALGALRPGVPTATVHPTLRDLMWAAGFLEGEGWFTMQNRCQKVSASQVEREPLERLQRFFGGSISRRVPASGQRPFYDWRATGSRGRGVMMTLYPLLCSRRQRQVKAALSEQPFAEER